MGDKEIETFIIFCLLYMVNGMEFGIFIETCWVYVERQLNPERPYLIYSIMIFARYLATAIFTFPLTYWHDRSRRTKLIMISLNFVSITGSFVYIVNTSFIFPVIGVIFTGFTIFDRTCGCWGNVKSIFTKRCYTKITFNDTFVIRWIFSCCIILIYLEKHAILCWTFFNWI